MAVGNSIPEQGWQSAICISKQETITTYVTSGTFIEFNSEALKEEQEEILLNSINTTRDHMKRLKGNGSVSGPIEMDLNANNDGCINLIKQAMGGTVTTAVNSTAVSFVHTINTGDMENNAGTNTSNDMKGLSVGVRKGQTNVWNVATCRVGTLSLAGEVGSPAVMTAELIGMSNTTGTTIGAAAVSFNNDLPVNFTGVTIETGDSITNVSEEYFTAFEFSINNNLDDGQRSLGGRYLSIAPPPGRREVKCTLTQRFDTMTSFNRFIQNTATAVKITLDSGFTMASSSVTSQVVIRIPQAYWNSNQPEVGDVGTLTHEVEISGIYDSSATYSVQIDVRNGTSSYY